MFTLHDRKALITGGGTGIDGVLGDDGRLFTARNGTAETLFGLAATTEQFISVPGNVQQATINVTGDSIIYNSPSDNGDNTGGQMAAFADLLHFQITGAQAGGVVEVYSIGAENDSNQATVQGFALESIPEPSSTALLGLGGLALVLRRRRA